MFHLVLSGHRRNLKQNTHIFVVAVVVVVVIVDVVVVVVVVLVVFVLVVTNKRLVVMARPVCAG